jgi:hypothetical protein
MIYRTSPFLALPMHVIRCIADFLSDGEIYLLGISCKALYPSMHGRVTSLIHMPAKDRALVLAWMERYNPDYYACFSCGTLRRYRTRILGRIFNDEKYHDNCYFWAALFRSNGWGFPWYSSFSSLPFYKAHLVMNRHFTGYGTPLDTISRIQVWKHYIPSSSRMVWMYGIWAPRIINNKLFLSKRLKFKIDGDY